MDFVCHRCSATLDPEAYYCPECGSPQVRYVAQQDDEIGRVITGAAAATELSETPAATSISWKMAIQIAAMVGLGVGILCALLAAGSVLWVAVGAVAVLGIYHRRRPKVLLETRIGARVGALVGLIAAAVALAANAVLLVIQRYGMHEGNQIDTQLTTIVKQAAAHAASMDSQAPVAVFTNFWLSAEGRIGLILLTMAFLSVLILLFAIAGGVLGAHIYRPSRRNNVPS